MIGGEFAPTLGAASSFSTRDSAVRLALQMLPAMYSDECRSPAAPMTPLFFLAMRAQYSRLRLIKPQTLS
jgi:hypothetical protein